MYESNRRQLTVTLTLVCVFRASLEGLHGPCVGIVCGVLSRLDVESALELVHGGGELIPASFVVGL